MLKAGVIGAGHLGKIHLKLLNQSTKYELIGFHDADPEASKNISSEFGYQSFTSIDDLIEACDVVDVVTPTLFHFDCAKKVLEAGKHLFIEKPITKTVEEAEIIRELAKKNGVRGQVGQVERFNPAFTAVNNQIDNPMFIETHRLAEFNPRGTDVSVVLDLMIHDIDAILSVVKSKVKTVTANGVSVISKTPDIANARIEFENGCVANLTASRISMNPLHGACSSILDGCRVRVLRAVSARVSLEGGIIF
jgi:predicted dehydrogenase